MRSDSLQVRLNPTTEEAFEKSKSNKKLPGQAVSYFLFDFGALCVAPSRTHLGPRWFESGGWRLCALIVYITMLDSASRASQVQELRRLAGA